MLNRVSYCFIHFFLFPVWAHSIRHLHFLVNSCDVLGRQFTPKIYRSTFNVPGRNKSSLSSLKCLIANKTKPFLQDGWIKKETRRNEPRVCLIECNSNEARHFSFTLIFIYIFEWHVIHRHQPCMTTFQWEKERTNSTKENSENKSKKTIEQDVALIEFIVFLSYVSFGFQPIFLANKNNKTLFK